ncbi:LysR family transcriptional regulator [Thalassomonas viridans]|uniref:LysR family transcriptional regulator n=1 Tax=Thalassomonas viridans TaxID=137584 RepID=A0AAE9Z2J4_9GAMM|nr:hydrogen peroxide-inducible genes activator [Thalassomonas viridans]WDE04864.1 LysR family transcriptional regulator [Thalassomonas viridans]
MISLKQLNYALAVAKSLHFKKAAESCNVSQSAMSTAINEMEKQLGFQVFERNNKQVLITNQGELFLNKAQTIKLEMDELHQLSQLNTRPLSAPMKIGVIPTIGPYLLPKVLPKVRADYPDFKLHIVEEQSHVLVDMVRRGDLDTAILALPFPIEGLMAFEFWQEDFYWISHQDDCPIGVNEIASNELELEKLMLLKDGHCLKEHALAACQLKQEEDEQEFAATSLHTLTQMVAGKIGTTLVPEMALAQLVQNNSEIRAVHLNEPGPHRRIAMIVRPNYVRVKDLELLKNLFRDALTHDQG